MLSAGCSYRPGSAGWPEARRGPDSHRANDQRKRSRQHRLGESRCPKDQLEDVVEDALEHLSKLSPAALAITKEAIYAWDSIHFDKGLARAEKIYLDELMKTEDAQEGINAFLEKREPQWKRK